MRTPLIAGNWKMYKTLSEARELVQGVRRGIDGVAGVDVLICPSFSLLFPMAKAVDGCSIMLGAQDAHPEPHGAYTGEVSVAMVVDTGCTWAILGHSERRKYFHESGPLLAKKVRAAIAGGLRVVYCVGETLEERESDQTQAMVRQHLHDVVQADIPPDKITIAYEPVWAIGTGKTASPEQAQEIHAFIRGELVSIYGQAAADSIRILYGGSVKPSNAADLLAQVDVDGALVGGACLVAGDFVAIIQAAAATVPVS